MIQGSPQIMLINSEIYPFPSIIQQRSPVDPLPELFILPIPIANALVDEAEPASAPLEPGQA